MQPRDPASPSPRARRRHRRITIPAGVLLFACVALPGYRDCGVSTAMAGDPLLVAICAFGLVAAALSLAVPARGRAERWIAIVLSAASFAAAGLLTLEWLSRNEAYAGVTVGTAAATCLLAGTIVWEREARGRDATARRLLRILQPLALAAVAATAALAEWTPLPDRDPATIYLGHS
jgi:peptidoglycan/LPS O-acetylase OafA/YrhL